MIEQTDHMQAILQKFQTTHDHIIDKCVELQEENETLKQKVEPDSQVMKLIAAQNQMIEMREKCRGLEKQYKALG